MNDFEDRLRGALNGQADNAPDDVSGLAEGARGRRRNRRRAIGGAVVAAALVAAIPIGLSVVNRDSGSSGDDTSAATDGDAIASEIPDGWRWESWRNLEVAVPGEWRDGSAYDFCIPGHPNPPEGNVSRDGYQADFEPDEAKQATCPQGVTFLAGKAEKPIAIPDGAVGERISLGGNTVDVVAKDQSTLDEVVDSAREIDGADSLGCAPTIEMGEGNYGTAEGPIVVCEYVVGGYREDRSTPVLDSSRTLKDKQSAPIRKLLEGTSPLPDADRATGGCTVGKGEPAYPVRRLMVGDTVLADISTAPCGSVQLVTDDGPQRIDYALLDALDPATMSLN